MWERLLIVVIISSLCLSTLAAAQSSQYNSADNNLGTWKWGSSSSSRADAYEDDDYGGTTWEQMYEDRLYEQELEKEDEPTSFSLLSAPVKIWRFFWPKKDEDEFEE